MLIEKKRGGGKVNNKVIYPNERVRSTFVFAFIWFEFKKNDQFEVSYSVRKIFHNL